MEKEKIVKLYRIQCHRIHLNNKNVGTNVYYIYNRKKNSIIRNKI